MHGPQVRVAGSCIIKWTGWETRCRTTVFTRPGQTGAVNCTDYRSFVQAGQGTTEQKKA